MRFALLFVTSLVLTPFAAFAHPDHDDGEEEQSIEQTARDAVIRLITQAKLSASWTRARIVGTHARRVRGAAQTVVTFRNDAEKLAAKRSFHVVLSGNGEVISAGHVLK